MENYLQNYGFIEQTGYISTEISNEEAINEIQSLIPSEATKENQLADKNYVQEYSGGGAIF